MMYTQAMAQGHNSQTGSGPKTNTSSGASAGAFLSLLLHAINEEMKDVPGFSEATSGRMKQGAQVGRGIVILTSDCGPEQQEAIKDVVQELLREHKADVFPLAVVNRDSTEEAIQYETALENVEADMLTLSEDDEFKEKVLVVKVRNHPAAGLFVFVDDKVKGQERAALEERLKTELISPVRIYDHSVYKAYQ